MVCMVLDCSSVRFRSLRPDEIRYRGDKRIDVPLRRQATQGSLSWPTGLRKKKSFPVWFRNLKRVEERQRKIGDSP